MSDKAHVILLPYPAQGHINPVLQFAKRLTLKGLKATLATTPYTISSIHAPMVDIQPVSDGYDEGGFKQAPSVEAYLQSYKSVGSKSLSELILKFKESDLSVNCIIYDSLLPWALDVAKQFGIYGAVFLTNSASVCSIFWHIQKGLLPFPLKQETLPISIPGFPPLGLSDLPSFVAHPAQHPAYLAAILEKFESLEQNDWVFCNSFEELESELEKVMKDSWPVAMVGPAIPSAYLDQPNEGDKSYGASLWKQNSDSYLTWLQRKPPGSVVYLSFGSMGSISTQQAEEIALGLKTSRKHFLLVVKESEKEFSSEFSSKIGDTGRIVAWCNQLEVLGHPAVGCFVTHCGWNSVLEGLSTGVPMVGVPQWTDQPMNAKLVEEMCRTGVRARRNENGILTGEELARCIREVMDGEKSESMKENAARWRELAVRAVSRGGSSDKNIEEFARSLMSEVRK